MNDKIQRYDIHGEIMIMEKDHLKAIEAKDKEIHYAEMAAKQEAKWLDEAQQTIEAQAKEIEQLKKTKDLAQQLCMSHVGHIEEQEKEIEQLHSERKNIMCGYCGETFFKYSSINPTPSEHEKAIAAFVNHDATCEKNFLTIQIKKQAKEIESLKAKAFKAGSAWGEIKTENNKLKNEVAELRAMLHRSCK